MEELAIAVIALLALLLFIGGVTWIIRKADEPSGLKAKANKLEQESADLRALRVLVMSIHRRAAEGRSVADPGLTVIADMIENSMRTETRFVKRGGK